MKFSHQNSHQNIKLRKAFSLIEISVVLLIIGVLIAGISQGVDLYSEFKIKTAQNLTINSRVGRIDDLALWLETTLEKSFQTKMLNNSEVTRWNNISPFDLNPKNAFSYLIDPNVSKQPTFLENNINGLPAIQFKNSSKNCMSVESGFDNNTENVTIFVALAMTSASVNGRIIEKWSDPNKPYPYVLRPRFNFATYYGAVIGSKSVQSLGKIGAPNIVSARRVKFENLSIWVNGVKGVVTDNNPTDTTNTSPLYIGCRGAGSADYAYGDFNVGEIIIYSRALSDIEISRVNQYLSQKWNIKF
jgi:prepilin-type N-terminal cleavage/methylation domain-containing protein